MACLLCSSSACLLRGCSGGAGLRSREEAEERKMEMYGVLE
uniref:Uncharacterized protein n=1 Tax=Arundo donax TaxID=35708 RepID=A0A0A8Y930_ARUDO